LVWNIKKFWGTTSWYQLVCILLVVNSRIVLYCHRKTSARLEAVIMALDLFLIESIWCEVSLLHCQVGSVVADLQAGQGRHEPQRRVPGSRLLLRWLSDLSESTKPLASSPASGFITRNALMKGDSGVADLT
jgi:hypothetical protein